MSMSTGVIGLKPPYETWKKMKAILDACKAVEINPPDEVSRFFDGEPDEKGQQVKIPFSKCSGNDYQGIEIEVTKIPKHVKIIRFYNSW